jgi:peptide/nickel transport system ATP-binding protein
VAETLLVEDSSQKLAQLCGLTVTYVPEHGRPILAVADVSMHFRPGEVVGIIGESGSGKSTLAAAMLELLPPHAYTGKGSILLDGRDLLTMSEPELRKIRGGRISLIPQDPAVSLNPVIKVGETRTASAWICVLAGRRSPTEST